LGGLGFFSTIATRPFAAAASFVLSSGFLKSRGICLSGHQEGNLQAPLHDFSKALDMEYQDLFNSDFWSEEDLQRRGAELSRESEWLEVFFELSDYGQVRLLENLSILRRKWMDCLPVCPAQTLSDSEVRYGLQESLLSAFPEAVSPAQFCSDCGLVDHPLHHLACSSTSALRTTRHTAINYCFEMAMKEVNAGSIKHSPYVGMGSDGASRFADTAATVCGNHSHFDYTVVTATYSKKIRVPSEGEVNQQTELDGYQEPSPVSLLGRSL
jgi:hypothetical protein